MAIPGSYTIVLPHTLQAQPPLNPQGEAFTTFGVETEKLDQPWCFYDNPHNLLGVPVGLVIKVVCTATNYSQQGGFAAVWAATAHITVVKPLGWPDPS
jgi:hypothetical protein